MRFDVARATVNRWERGHRPVLGMAALAIRQLAAASALPKQGRR